MFDGWLTTYRTQFFSIYLTWLVTMTISKNRFNPIYWRLCGDDAPTWWTFLNWKITKRFPFLRFILPFAFYFNLSMFCRRIFNCFQVALWQAIKFWFSIGSTTEHFNIYWKKILIGIGNYWKRVSTTSW